MNTIRDYRRALIMMRIEIALTAMMISMPVMNLFFEDIGMNRAAIGLSQSIFTVAMFFIDIPSGWLADRLSRKWANAIGDGIVAVALLLYSQSDGLAQVVACEIVLALGAALSNGADRPMLRHYCERIWAERPGGSGSALKNIDAMNSIWRSVAQGTGVVAGGLIGAYGARWAIMISAIPFAVSAWLCTKLIEPPRRDRASTPPSHTSKLRSTLSDLRNVVSSHMLARNEVTGLVYACAVAENSTHAMIWLLTPLLLIAGIPVKLLGASWALNLILAAAGSYCAKRLASNMSDRGVFIIGTAPVVLACVVMSIQTSLWTVWLYLVLGFARGWSAAAIRPRLTLRAPMEHLATIESISSTISRVMYIPMVYLIGRLSDTSMSIALVANAVLVAVPCLLVALRLSHERQAT